MYLNRFPYISCLICIIVVRSEAFVKYNATWKSLDSRPLPDWYDDAKFGIFMHWGVYSVPGHDGAWMWYYWKGPNPSKETVAFMKKNYPPDWTYADFASQFKATFYDPNKWASIFKASGAKYVVLTSKHHEGFTNFPSKYSFNWNAMDVGPNRDLVGDYADAMRSAGLHVGLYYSLLEFFNPLYLQDKSNRFKTDYFVKSKSEPELYQLINTYKPDVIWSDGNWEASSDYWNSKNFLAWLYNDSPVRDTVVTNDRWGSETQCEHGGYYTCHDKYSPGVLQKHKWENCNTMDRGMWAHRRDISFEDVQSMPNLIQMLTSTVSCGGNLLLNVGPTADGVIIPIFEERLRQIGDWLRVNGEAIYGTKPWKFQNDTITKNIWYTSKITSKGLDVYAFLLDWPVENAVFLGAPIPSKTTVSLLGYTATPLQWTKGQPGGIKIQLPVLSPSQLPCQWAWTLKLTNLLNK